MSDEVPFEAQSPSSLRQRNAPPSPVLLDELILEILSWLPVKSLLKLRCVCKSWKSLIPSPDFVKLHLTRSARNLTLLLLWLWRTDDTQKDSPYPGLIPLSLRSLLQNPSCNLAQHNWYPTNDVDGNVYIPIGSCNGLVCLYHGFSRNSFDGDYSFCLVNPATKLRSKRLARLSDNGIFKFAFGYDKLSDTYKLVAFRLDDKPDQVKICCFGDNCWRNIRCFPAVPFVTLRPNGSNYVGHNRGTYFNGTLNWLALCNEDYFWNDTIATDQLVIVSLDMGTETWTQFLLPGSTDEAPQSEPTIGVLMDSLCFYQDYNRTHFIIWKMKEFGIEKSWTQFMKFSYQGLQIDSLEFPSPLLPLCMSEDGDVLIMAINHELDSQAIVFHRRDNRVERTKLPEYILWYYTKYYVESLVSPSCN